MSAFKGRWIPENAHVHLVTKLERLHLKQESVDAFNDEYRQILSLLGVEDLTTCKEADQYYHIYFSKIKDPIVLSAIQQHSLFVKGLNLQQLMEDVSSLWLTKPKLHTSTG